MTSKMFWERWVKNAAGACESSVRSFTLTQHKRLLTKFLPSDNLNNSGTVRVQHIMQTLDVREACLSP